MVTDDAIETDDAQLRRIARGRISVMLLGETGVGKGVAARRIHALSARSRAPFIRLNCAAFSDSLLESELCGYERGAFTGADRAKPGMLELADGGTVFLDEVAEMPPSLQARLLHIVEEKEVRRVGGTSVHRVDIRLISATHQQISGARGAMRGDLYYRLSGAVIRIPHGFAIAMNCGDALHTLVWEHLTHLDTSDSTLIALQRRFARALKCCAVGQGIDLSCGRQFRTPFALRQYLLMVLGKTGALLALSCELAPALSQRDDVHRWRCFGEELALAYQLRDDVLDLTGLRSGKNLAGDLRNGKPTLILSHFFRHARREDRHLLEQTLSTEEVCPESLERAIELLDDYGSIRYVDRMARAIASDATRRLEGVPHGADRTALKSIVEYAVEREQ